MMMMTLKYYARFLARLFTLTSVTMADAGKSQRNIEIKAKIADEKEFDEKIKIAKDLTGQKADILVQHDVFFKVPMGRLKLRYEVRLFYFSTLQLFFNTFFSSG